ncbi:sulfite exporter TauE/SafE family protein, partial [Candidatus Curtissbacteria bacterium]|nr:sulfite exporter TauE/SafE family protein [Candidatus Curtissbacteria bacterium]
YEQTVKEVPIPPHEKIDVTAISEKAATLLTLKPLTEKTANELGIGTARPTFTTFVKAADNVANKSVGLVLNDEKAQQEALYSLEGLDRYELGQNINALSARQRELDQIIKKQNPTNPDYFRNKLEYKNNIDRLRYYQNAKKFSDSQPKRVQTYLSYFKHLPPGKQINMATVIAKDTTKNLIGMPFIPIKVIKSFPKTVVSSASPKSIFKMVYSPVGEFKSSTMFMLRSPKGLIFAPKTILKNEMFMAGQTFGALGFNLGNFRMAKNILTMNIGGIAMGMGITPAGIATTFTKKALKISGGIFGGLLYLFVSLGGAALTGFLVGAAIGGGIGLVTGGIIGFQVGLATAPFFGPFAIITVPAFTLAGGLIGALVGAGIGGAAGGLLMYGMSGGGTPAATAGVGVGVGGVTGAILGGFLGSFLGPVGTAIGAVVGAYVGAIVGGMVGYGIGKLITALGPAPSGAILGGALGFMIGGPALMVFMAFTGWLLGGGWTIIKDFIGDAFGTAGGAVGSVFGGITGAVSAIWNGITGAGSGLLNALGNIAGGFSNAISNIASTSVSTVTGTATFVTLGSIGALAWFTGISTSTAFTSADTDLSKITAGNNQYFQVTKVADKSHLENPPPNQEITFTINLTAKDTKLSEVKVTDEMNVQKKSGSPFTVTVDKDNKPFSPITDCQKEYNPKDTCQYIFKITVDDRFIDSTITNTVKVTATPEGQSPVQDSTSAIVTVGAPPTSCFTFEGDWNSSDKTAENDAIANLSRATTYMSYLCAQGNVKLVRESGSDWNRTSCPSTIHLTDIGVGSNNKNALYVLAHESGHVLQCHGLQAYQDFLSQQPWNPEGYICSYPLGKTSYEDFAESIAIYVVWHGFNVRGCPSSTINMPEQYPQHYQFHKSKLFGGFEF